MSKACFPQTYSVEYVNFLEWQLRLLSLPDEIVTVLGVLLYILSPSGLQSPDASTFLPTTSVRPVSSTVLVGGTWRPLVGRTSCPAGSPLQWT